MLDVVELEGANRCASFYVAFIYLQMGIRVLTRQWRESDAGAYLSISIALLVLIFAYLSGVLGDSHLFNHPARIFLKGIHTSYQLVVNGESAY